MKSLAFVLALLVSGVAAAGVLVPSSLVWVARHSLTPRAFYVIGAIRIAFGVILVAAASASRMPKALRFLGYLIVVAGLTAALMGLVAMEQARAIVEWWLQQGSGVIRLTALVALAVGSFIALACAPRG